MTEEQFADWSWRIPFLASALLVAVGLYVRRRVTETPEFTRLAARAGQVQTPLDTVLRYHGRNLVLGPLAMVVCDAIFYVSTMFALDYGTRVAHIPRGTLLGFLCIAIVFMAVMTPVSAALSDRFGCRPVLLWDRPLLRRRALQWRRCWGQARRTAPRPSSAWSLR